MFASSVRLLGRPWELIYEHFPSTVGKKLEYLVALKRETQFMTFNNHNFPFCKIVNALRHKVSTHILIDVAQLVNNVLYL